jgi:hypothetical protein
MKKILIKKIAKAKKATTKRMRVKFGRKKTKRR